MWYYECNFTHLTDNEYPNPNIGAPALDEEVGDETTKDGSQGTTDQGNPGHEMVNLCIGQTLRLEEQLRVVSPHVPTSVSYSSCDAEHEHAREEERFDEEEKSRGKTRLNGVLCLFFHLQVLGAFWFLDCEQNDRSRSNTCKRVCACLLWSIIRSDFTISL